MEEHRPEAIFSVRSSIETTFILVFIFSLIRVHLWLRIASISIVEAVVDTLPTSRDHGIVNALGTFECPQEQDADQAGE